MTIKPVIATKPSPYQGEQGRTREFLEGLQIGPYHVSYDNPGISFVTKRGGSPNGVYVSRKGDGTTVHIVPSQDLLFQWSVGHSNHDLVEETGMEYRFEREDRKKKPWFKRVVPTIYRGEMPHPMLPELSSDTNDVLMSMIGTGHDYFARTLGIRAAASELFQGDTALKERAVNSRIQQGYQPGLNLSALLRRADEQKDLPADYVSPDERMVVGAMDEVFETVKQEMSRRESQRGRVRELFQRVIF